MFEPSVPYYITVELFNGMMLSFGMDSVNILFQIIQHYALSLHCWLLSKIPNGLSFWFWLVQVVLEIRPLKECCCLGLCMMDGLSPTEQHQL